MSTYFRKFGPYFDVMNLRNKYTNALALDKKYSLHFKIYFNI